MKLIKPSKIYFIKLGSGGDWEKECIENQQTIRLGFGDADHSDCLAGNWDKVRDYYLASRAKGKATEFANQIKAFYESDAETLWITFYGDWLWWCFADPKVEKLSDGTKIRRVIGKWRNSDTTGNLLSLDVLNGKLLQVRGFRGTICSVKESKYTTDKINGWQTEEVKQARIAKITLNDCLKPLIKNLTWKDFEILVDLVFVQSGWKRLSVLGKTEKSWDLELLAPVTGERSKVQIKSQSSRQELNDYIEEFEALKKSHSRLFYVVHSFVGDLPESSLPSYVTLIGLDKLSELVVNAGLSDWLIKKNS
jgi:hypothetical protein